MARSVPAKGVTVRSLVLAAASRLERAGVSFGHGTSNAIDEAAWLVLHSLGLPVADLGPWLDLAVDSDRAKAANALVTKRIRTRKPAAYLLNEAWLGPHRFYVDERVIVPRSFIAELLRARLAPWIAGPARVRSVLDLCTGSGCLAILAALAFPKAKVDAADLSGRRAGGRARERRRLPPRAPACVSCNRISSAHSADAPTISSSPIRPT